MCTDCSTVCSDCSTTGSDCSAIYSDCSTVCDPPVFIYSVFRRLDENGNQRINLKEFQDGLRELHVRVDYNAMLDTFHLLDADKSGTIDFDEFVTAMRVSLA